MPWKHKSQVMHVRLPDKYFAAVERYATFLGVAHSTAAARLIERGLDSLDAETRTPFERLAAVEAMLHEERESIEQVTSGQDQLTKDLEAISAQLATVVKIAMDSVTASRLLLRKVSPDDFKSLEDFSKKGLEGLATGASPKKS